VGYLSLASWYQACKLELCTWAELRDILPELENSGRQNYDKIIGIKWKN
jgi:hypothetical protein